VLVLYRDSSYAEALEVALQARTVLGTTGRLAWLPWFWIACLRCRVGAYDEALTTLQEMLDRQLLWRTSLLRDKDFDPIREWPKFQAIVAEADRRLRSLRAKPEVLLWPPEPATSNPPLLLALHGANGNAQDFATHWMSARQAGFVVASGQSSQPTSPEYFCWDDWEIANQDLAAFYQIIRERQVFDHARVLVTGFSQGGAIAIRSALGQRPFAIRGVVAVCPSIGDPSTWRPLIESHSAPGLRGVMLVGTADPWRDGAEQVHQGLLDAGVDITLELVDGLAHAFPGDFPTRLQRMLPQFSEA
jgi:predicted esterase